DLAPAQAGQGRARRTRVPARPVSQSHGERRVITSKGGVATSRDELLVVLSAPRGFANDRRFKAIESGCTGWNRLRLLIQPQPTSSCQLSIRLSTRGHAPTTRSSPAECPEDTLTCLRRLGKVGEGRLILIRSRENRQQVGEWREVSRLDRGIERLFDAMIARNESWIDGSH